MKSTISILLLLGSSWLATSGATAQTQAREVHTYSVTPTVRANDYPYHDRKDTQRKQKKDDPYKVRVHRQRIRVRHNPLETALCCRFESAVRIGLVGSHFTCVAPLSADYIPSLVRKRGPPAV